MEPGGDESKLATRSRTPGDFEVIQASHETVNGLLGGTKSDLADGVMVQRAWNYRGTAYQTVRMQFPKMSDFIWPFKSAHPVNVKFNRERRVNAESSGRGFGTDTGWGYVNLTASPQNKYTMGWGYGPLASSAVRHLLLDVVLPPQRLHPLRRGLRPPRAALHGLLLFRAIGDGGTAAETQKASVSEYASPTAWGVNGVNGSIQEGNIQVQAFEQVGSTMYVGGNFSPASRRARTVRRSPPAASPPSTRPRECGPARPSTPGARAAQRQAPRRR